MLRNIDQSNGLCNETRLRVDWLMESCIDATIIHKIHFGKRWLSEDENITLRSTFSVKDSKKVVPSVRLFHDEIEDFAEWILKLGYGKFREANDGEVNIDIPNEFLIMDSNDPICSIINFTYLNMLNNLDDNKCFTKKAILSLTNEVVDTINDELLSVILGE